MANKQTAVEYLLENMYLITGLKWDEVIEQAKEIEKEQIMKANYDGFVEGINVEDNDYEIKTNEQYYDETYGK